MTMYTAEIIIYFIILIASLLVILAIFNLRNSQKHVESIHIGDIFANNSFKFSDIDDPFSENYNTPGFDTRYYVTILDIKKNYKGETWVKYCFTKNIDNPNHCTWSDEINRFLKYRTRISKIIDNINTEE